MFEGKGLMASMVTSFQKDGSLDEAAIVKNVQFQQKAGIRTIVVLGGTGEPVSLSSAERERVVALSIEAAGSGLDVVSSAMVGNPDEVVSDVRMAARLGAKACMITSPPFVRPADNDVYRFVKQVAAASPIPLILFNVPSRTGFLMSADLVARMVRDIDALIAIKESSRDMVLFSEIRQRTPERFACLQGVDSLYLPSLVVGGEGGILASTAVLPEFTLAIEKAFAAGDIPLAQKHHFALLDFLRLLFESSHPAPLKHAMEVRGLPAGQTRAPFYGISDDLQQRVAAGLALLMQQFGLESA